MCKRALHTARPSRTEPSCSWAISKRYLTLTSKTDGSKAEKRFTSSSTPCRSLSFFFANCQHTTSGERGTQLQYHTSYTAKEKQAKKLQVTNRKSHQLTNTALGLFLFSTETRPSRLVTSNQKVLRFRSELPGTETCSKKSSGVQY